MNFKEFPMSVTPKNLPKRTRVLVKDLLFQEKYLLTDTQVDIMSYIFNAFTWARRENGYLILTNNKITEDMPQIGEKTLEASLRELEYRGLIEKSIVKVPAWRNARVRGIKITSYGMKYNSSLYSPSHQDIISVFQERIAELEKEKAEREKAEVAEEIEEQEKIEEPQEPKKLQTYQKVEVPSPKEATIKPSTTSIEKSKPIPKPDTTEPLESFILRTRNRFLLSSQMICNKVEGWEQETIFCINSYGKLSLITKNQEFMQVANPLAINKFWQWLFGNQHRIGEIIDFQKIKDDVAKLSKKYENRELRINGKTRWIEELMSMNDGVAIKVRDENGNVNVLANAPYKPIVYTLDALEERILKWEVREKERINAQNL